MQHLLLLIQKWSKLICLSFFLLFAQGIFSATKYLYVGETYQLETPNPVSSNGYIDGAFVLNSADRLYVDVNDPFNVTITVLKYFSNIVTVKVRFVEKYTYNGHIQKLDHDVELLIGAKTPTVSIPTGSETIKIGVGEKGKLRFKVTPSGLYAPEMEFFINPLELPCLASDDDGRTIQNFQYDRTTGEGYLEIQGSTYHGGTNHIYCYIYGELSKLMWTVDVEDNRPTISADVKAGTVKKGTKVTLTSDKKNTDIYYTIDGSKPSKNSNKYTEPIVINKSLTLKARGYIGDIEGDVLTKKYTIEQEKILLSASPSGGEVSKGTIVYIKSSNVPDAQIYYTLDGSKPSDKSILYTSSGITIDEACTLQAIAYKDGYDDSDILKVKYSLEKELFVNETNFPDINFRNSILEQGIRTEDDVLNAKNLFVSGKGIESLKGIELFTSLEKLVCSMNKLTSLDVSKNTKLTLISYYGNNIHGANLDAFINSLPINNAKDKRLIVDDRMVKITEYPSDGLTTTQVAKAKERGWTPYYSCLIVYDDLEYEGYEEKPLSIDAINFPDENFRKYLLEQEFGKDGIVTPDENGKIKNIYCTGKGIRNLKGIEFFTYLEKLDCLNNQLSTIDVSKNTALELLACDQNQLTSLDLSNNRALKTLWCNSNQLTYLDLSNNVALETLWCYDNQISTLNISNSTALINLECQGNQLTSLDVSKNLALNKLWCDFNQLTSLDVSKNTNLIDLGCSRNKIRGGAMDDLVKSLPMNTTKDEHKFSVVSKSSNEGNVCTKDQVAIAKSRGWTSYCGSEKYEGSDPTAIDGVVTDIKDDAPIYNLNGQRLDKPRKGINIIGGKKVIVR